ncbi:MAG: hypothetical protein Q4A71_05865 [Actinomycetaceae bacterium]|nr:hypothetical protein [Actinomycetaceae bacterium]
MKRAVPVDTKDKRAKTDISGNYPHQYLHAKVTFASTIGRAVIFIILAVAWVGAPSPLSWLLRPVAVMMVIESVVFGLLYANGAFYKISLIAYRRLHVVWYCLHVLTFCLLLGGILQATIFQGAPNLITLLSDYPQLIAPLLYYGPAVILIPLIKRSVPDFTTQLVA